ncbi:MAG: MFS transporter [Gammaproteobacteria bacterium]|nr:MFS transporter [Gammaproteobacteria bacterium]
MFEGSNVNFQKQTDGRPAEPLGTYEYRWPALFTLLAASFMNLLDTSIITVGLPTLQENLHANEKQIQWVVEVYILVYALGLLPLARFGDIVGRKVMFLVGIVFFIATSALCGVVLSAEMLVLARGLQGLAAAMMSSQVIAIAQTMFSPKERPHAFPLFGVVAGVSGIAGPILSGLLLHANFFDLGWRQLFLINIPMGVLTYLAASAWVPRCPPHPGLKNDWLGISLASVAIFSLVYPLVEGRVLGWPIWTLLSMFACVPLLAAFVWWESVLARKGGSTLLPIQLMSNHDYLLGAGAVLVFFSALQGFFLVFALFLQMGLGFTPLQSGLSVAPFPIGILLATVVSGQIRNLKLKIIAGSLLLVASFLVLGAIVIHGSAGLGTMDFSLPLLVGGVGSGMCISSLFQTIMLTVPLKDAGAGSGAMQVFQQVGACIGIALVSVIFYSGIGSQYTGYQTESMFKIAFLHTIAYELFAYLLVGAAALKLKFELPNNSVGPIRQG